MKRDPRILLEDVEQAAEEIAKFVEGVGFAAYDGNIEKQRAVERSFGIIGEALNRLRRSAPQLAERIPELARVVDFRNLLAHVYHRVSAKAVWDTAVNDLPQLSRTVQSLLAELEQTETAPKSGEVGSPEDSGSGRIVPDPNSPPSPFDLD